MDSREPIALALDHKQPDRVPIDYERSLWEQEVGGSNPSAPTICFNTLRDSGLFRKHACS